MVRKIILIFLVLQFSWLRAQDDWKLVKEKNEIRVYTKSKEHDNFKTFKAQITIDATIHAFVALLKDIDNFKDWGHKISEASILEREGETLQIYYSVAKTPFPYKDRDGIYLNRFRWMSDSNTLIVDIEVLDDYLEQKNNFVRIKGEGFWKVKVLPKGQLDIIFQLQIDPGGSIPAWMANIFIDDSPYHTLLNIKETIKKEKYHQQEFDFIN